jgi:hypothetical protein
MVYGGRCRTIYIATRSATRRGRTGGGGQKQKVLRNAVSCSICRYHADPDGSAPWRHECGGSAGAADVGCPDGRTACLEQQGISNRGCPSYTLDVSYRAAEKLLRYRAVLMLGLPPSAEPVAGSGISGHADRASRLVHQHRSSRGIPGYCRICSLPTLKIISYC